MEPRGSFIDLRGLGAIGASFGSSQPSLSVCAPDYPVAQWTIHSAMVTRSLIGFLILGAPDCLLRLDNRWTPWQPRNSQRITRLFGDQTQTVWKVIAEVLKAKEFESYSHLVVRCTPESLVGGT
jgi:hypothetical protein